MVSTAPVNGDEWGNALKHEAKGVASLVSKCNSTTLGDAASHLQPKDTKKWNLYRYYVARYDSLLGRPCRQRSPEAQVQTTF